MVRTVYSLFSKALPKGLTVCGVFTRDYRHDTLNCQVRHGRERIVGNSIYQHFSRHVKVLMWVYTELTITFRNRFMFYHWLCYFYLIIWITFTKLYFLCKVKCFSFLKFQHEEAAAFSGDGFKLWWFYFPHV